MLRIYHLIVVWVKVPTVGENRIVSVAELNVFLKVLLKYFALLFIALYCLIYSPFRLPSWSDEFSSSSVSFIVSFWTFCQYPESPEFGFLPWRVSIAPMRALTSSSASASRLSIILSVILIYLSLTVMDTIVCCYLNTFKLFTMFHLCFYLPTKSMIAFYLPLFATIFLFFHSLFHLCDDDIPLVHFIRLKL